MGERPQLARQIRDGRQHAHEIGERIRDEAGQHGDAETRARGGTLVGMIELDLEYPIRYYGDYVRVYQSPSDASS